MKVLQKIILTLVLSSILISALVVMGIAFFKFEQILEDNSGHISRMRALIDTTATYTDGAVSVYYRLDAGIRGPKQGDLLIQYGANMLKNNKALYLQIKPIFENNSKIGFFCPTFCHM